MTRHVRSVAAALPNANGSPTEFFEHTINAVRATGSDRAHSHLSPPEHVEASLAICKSALGRVATTSYVNALRG